MSIPRTAAVLDWESNVEAAIQRGHIASDREHLIAAAPAEVSDPGQRIEQLRLAFDGEPSDRREWCDRARWARMAVSLRARITGLAGGLRGTDLAVYIGLAELADRDGLRMRYSTYRVAEWVGLSRRGLQNALERLCIEMWVVKVHESEGGLTQASRPNCTSVYEVLTLPEHPGGKLTQTKRRNVLDPSRKQGRFQFLPGGERRAHKAGGERRAHKGGRTTCAQ